MVCQCERDRRDRDVRQQQRLPRWRLHHGQGNRAAAHREGQHDERQHRHVVQRELRQADLRERDRARWDRACSSVARTTSSTASPRAGIASLDPTTGATMPWAATGVSPRLANGGCDANLTDIVIQGSIAYVTAEAPSPGCWEGYYAANISDGSLIYNERCLGGSAALAVANGWVYRGLAQPRLRQERRRVRRAEQLQQLRLLPPRGPPDLRRSARPLEPQHRRREPRDLHDGRPPGDGDRRHQHLRRRRPEHRSTASASRAWPGSASPVGTRRPRCQRRHGSPRPPPAHSSISAEGVSDDNDGILTLRALPRRRQHARSRPTTGESWPWSKPVLHFKDSGLTAGTSHSYQLTASDGSATTIRGPANVPVTVGWQNPPAYPAAVTATGGATAHWRLDDTGEPDGGQLRKQQHRATSSAGSPPASPAPCSTTPRSRPTGPTATSPRRRRSPPLPRSRSRCGSRRPPSSVGRSWASPTPRPERARCDNRAIWMDNDGKIGFGVRTRPRPPRPGSPPNTFPNSFVRSLGTYNDGSWHQATAVFNGTDNISLYLDGVLNQILNVTQPILPDERVPAGRLHGPHRVLHGVRHELRRVPGRHERATGRAASTKRACTTPRSAPSRSRRCTPPAPRTVPRSRPSRPTPGPRRPHRRPARTRARWPPTHRRCTGASVSSASCPSPTRRATTGPGRTATETLRPARCTGRRLYRCPRRTGPGSPTATSGRPNPQTYSLEAWVKTASFNGGKILGLENARTGWGTTYDRQIYMTSNGRIAYGILAGGSQQVITSTTQYNDDTYHHVVATQGVEGMALYVDGALIGTNPTVAPDAANGYWRLGGGNLTGWPNAPSSSNLAGTFDEVAVYPVALSAARVAAHFNPTSVPPAAPDEPPRDRRHVELGRPGVERTGGRHRQLQRVPGRGPRRISAGHELHGHRSHRRDGIQLHGERGEQQRARITRDGPGGRDDCRARRGSTVDSGRPRGTDGHRHQRGPHVERFHRQRRRHAATRCAATGC